MEKYLGLKLVSAEPQTLDQSAGAENKGDLSKLHGGIDQDGYKVVYEDGYTSWSPKDVFENAYRKIKTFDFDNLASRRSEEYQIRVCEEARELDYKTNKLQAFINNPATPFIILPKDEQIRLKQQLMAMQYYLTILVERINNF